MMLMEVYCSPDDFILIFYHWKCWCCFDLCIGCKQIIFKMDRYGNGEQMVLDKVFDSVARSPSFRNFNMDLFTGEFTVTR
jgi:hypothetical protein